jgi:ATP-dependent Zn protease
LKKKTKIWIWIAVGIGIAALLWVLFSDIIGGAKELNFTQLMSAIHNGKYWDGEKWITLEAPITKVYLDAYQWTAITKDGQQYIAIGPSMYDSAAIEVVETLAGKGIYIDYADPNSGSIWSSILPFAGMLLIGLLFFFMLRGAASGGPNMNMNKSKTQVQTNLKVRFSDVAGAE